jgi:hypothetical protein
MHFVEEIGFRIVAIVILPGNLYAKNTVIMRSERATSFFEFVGPIEAAGLRSFVKCLHHVFVCFEGFIGFTC